jgi:hypothetical protein
VAATRRGEAQAAAARERGAARAAARARRAHAGRSRCVRQQAISTCNSSRRAR